MSLLKKCVGDHTDYKATSPLITTGQGHILQLVAVLQFRNILKNSISVCQALVKWDSYVVDDTSWEDCELLHSYFPHLDLGDKVIVKEGGGGYC